MSRIDRINEELRHHISIIVQQELRDPHLGFVTVTKVETAPDLHGVNVFFTALGDEKSLRAAIKALKKSEGYVRKLVGERVRIKFTPRINFVYDDTMKKSDRIEEILKKIHEEKGPEDVS